MGGTQGWLSTLWSLSVIDKDGEDVRKLREQRLGDRVIKRVNKCIANAFLGFLAQCALFYLSLFLISHQCLLHVSTRYCQLEERRQTYIRCKPLEVAVYGFLLYMGIEDLLRKVSIRLSAALRRVMNSFCREDINLFDTANHKQNPQVMINMATMYMVKDLVEILINQMISRTTIVHHTCVLLAYSHVVTVLQGDYNVEGIFKVERELEG